MHGGAKGRVALGCLLNVGVEMGFGRQLTLLGVPGQGLGVSEMNLPRIEQEGELWKVSFCPRRTKLCCWGKGSPQVSGVGRMTSLGGQD